MSKPFIIAIDGYSSCGKSTLAKALAKRLNFAFVDTGAMYRAVTLYLIRNGTDWENASEEELEEVLNKIRISFQYNRQRETSDTFLNGENVEEEIRGKEVSEMVSEVSQIAVIRRRMIGLQQKAGVQKKLVMDGRDIGTYVFPKAELKLFMTAKPEIRALRRFNELKVKGKELSIEEIEENLKHRDYNDTNRKESPLIKAEDAVEIDNSYLNEEQQLDVVMAILERKGLLR